jgi:hypothetical protein
VREGDRPKRKRTSVKASVAEGGDDEDGDESDGVSQACAWGNMCMYACLYVCMCVCVCARVCVCVCVVAAHAPTVSAWPKEHQQGQEGVRERVEY